MMMSRITEANERKVIATNLRTTEIQKAVKDALDDKRLDDLGAQLTNLATQMTEGFTKVQTRQDVANGRTSKNEQAIAEVKSKDSYEKFLWLLLTSLVGVVVYFVTRG